MAIRIEYLLLLLILLLIGSILGINPTAQEAKTSNTQREIAFENFSLYNLHTDRTIQEIFAVNMTKYKNHIEMLEVTLKDEKGYELFSNEAIYEEDMIYMESGVRVVSEEGFSFSTQSLNYNIENKRTQTKRPFVLEYNQSIIYGKNLVLDMEGKSLSADKIEAKIYFVTQE